MLVSALSTGAISYQLGWLEKKSTKLMKTQEENKQEGVACFCLDLLNKLD